MPVQRVPGPVKCHVIRQAYRQICFWHRHHAAIRAMDHRDRTSPIPLPRDPPVAQAELLHALTPTGFLGVGDRDINRFLPRSLIEPGKMVHPTDLLGLRWHERLIANRRVIIQCKERVRHRQFVLPAKIQIALVMRRTGKDRACPVVHQNEVRDPDGQLPVRIQRVFHADARVEALLVSLLQIRLRGPHGPALGTERGNLRIVPLQRLGQWVIRRDPDKARAHQRIGPGRVYIYRCILCGRIDGLKPEFQSTRLADPVGLHQSDLLGPVLQLADRLQQIIRHVRDLEDPLHTLLSFDRSPRSPALAVNHLLVCQYGLIDRIPVHDGSAARNKAAIQHIQEQRLLLRVVFRITGRELAGPIQAQAHLLQIRTHCVDIGIGPLARMYLALHGRVFRRHPERIPAHRVQNIEAAGPFVPGNDISHGVVSDMPHMDPAGRVREHL